MGVLGRWPEDNRKNLLRGLAAERARTKALASKASFGVVGAFENRAEPPNYDYFMVINSIRPSDVWSNLSNCSKAFVVFASASCLARANSSERSFPNFAS